MGDAGLAAWIQAWGSIAAILVSAAFAIAVPWSMRVIERRDHVRTTLRSGLHAGASILSGWQGVEGILQAGKWNTNTREVLRVSSRYSQKLLDHLDDAALPDGGLTAIGSMWVSVAAYDVFLDQVEAAFVAGSPLPSVKFALHLDLIASATRSLNKIAEPLKMNIAIG